MTGEFRDTTKTGTTQDKTTLRCQRQTWHRNLREPTLPTTNISGVLRPARWPFAKSLLAELRAIPPALRAADPTFASEWNDGYFALAGHAISVRDGFPIDESQAPEQWWIELHGFRWLRYIPQQFDTDIQSRTERLLAGWLRNRSSHHALAKLPSVVARRVMSWLSHSDILLQTNSAEFYDTVISALVTDVQALQLTWRQIPSPSDRLAALTALAAAGLCLTGAHKILKEAEAGLLSELDGRRGPAVQSVVRQPDSLLDLLLDLEILRRLYGQCSQPIPSALHEIMSPLKQAAGSLSLGDGHLARLSTPRLECGNRLMLANVIRHVGLVDPGPLLSVHGGFSRLKIGETIIVADIGAQLSNAHALELEVSSGAAPLLVHDGLPSAISDGRSVLIFASNSAETALSRGLPPVLEPIHNVSLDLSDPGRQQLDATHAGHSRRGIVHRRRLALKNNGDEIECTDELRSLIDGPSSTHLVFALRFVLHPTVEVTLVDADDRLELGLANGHRWRFSAPTRKLSVERALYRDGAKTTPTLQILVPSGSTSGGIVTWRLTRVK